LSTFFSDYCEYLIDIFSNNFDEYINDVYFIITNIDELKITMNELIEQLKNKLSRILASNTDEKKLTNYFL